jgi:NTP pyrophosphatase (non-canonical NTP hydrolase)
LSAVRRFGREFALELKQIFEIQKEFDRKLGWNTYEKCRTPEDVLKFMEHFVLVMVEELGEISRVRKQYHRDKQSFTVEELKHELMDIFVYFMQACMALNVDIEKDYLSKMKYNEKRFIRNSHG